MAISLMIVFIFLDHKLDTRTKKTVSSSLMIDLNGFCVLLRDTINFPVVLDQYDKIDAHTISPSTLTRNVSLYLD